MTTSAAINQTGSNRQGRLDIACAITGKRTETLQPRVLSLEELTTTTNCTERIATDDEH
jgi:hypothetical protein